MSLTGLLLSSLLLIVAGAVALVYGWAKASEPLIVASISFSTAAAVFMAMALYRSRPPRGSRKKKKARAGRSGK